jgi:predicted nucleic acid-binding protein
LKAFIGTNVLLDVLLKREEFHDDSAAVWTLAESGKIRGMISPVSVTNVYYIVRRLCDHRTAMEGARLLRDAFVLVKCDERAITQAIDAGFKDLEDGVQYFCAVQAGAQCIISRDPGDFGRSDLPVLSPAEFLAAHSFEQAP